MQADARSPFLTDFGYLSVLGFWNFTEERGVFLQNFTKIYAYMVFAEIFFGYDKAQIKREAKKNDSTDSKDKKQQQHSPKQQKTGPETTGETEENSGITLSVDSAGNAAFYSI